MSLKEQLDSILADKRANLLPSNIRIGTTIMGVKGTLPPPAENRTVKMFKTKAEMDADTSPELDDLAVVYGKETVSVLTSNYTELHLPNSITFDEPIEYNELRGYIDNQGFFSEVRVMFSASQIYVTVYGESQHFNCVYESEDGMNYTTSETELDFVSENVLPILEYMNTSEERQYDVSWLNAKMLYFSGVYKYDGQQYIAAPTQFSLSSQNQLLKNLIAYGSVGSVQGDGSYISNIPNNDFIDRYIGDSYKYTGVSSLQAGSRVRNQTFVEKLRYDNTSDITDDDAIAYSSTSEKIVEDYSNLEVFTTSWTKTQSNTIQHNNKLYYVFVGFNGTKTTLGSSSTPAYRNITKMGYAVINITDNELLVHQIGTCNFNPVSKSTLQSSQYAAMLNTIGYDFTNNTLYCLWYSDNWGWNICYVYGITSYPKDGAISHKTYEHKGGWDYRTIHDSMWNSIDNNFICRLGCWKSGQTTYYRILLSITPDGVVTELITNTTEKSIYWTNSAYGYGRVILIQNQADSTPRYKPFNTSTKAYLGPIGNSSSYRLLQYGDNAIFIGKDSDSDTTYNIYSFNSSTNTYSKLVEGVLDTQLYMLLVNGEYKFKHNNIVYNIDGSVYDLKLPTNVSSPWTRIMEVVDDELSDIFSTSTSISSGVITVTNYTFKMSVYRDITEFPISGILCIVLSGKNSNTGNNMTYKYNCFELTKTSYDGTISPTEYVQALDTANEIKGGNE